jgi:hypothetical protein
LRLAVKTLEQRRIIGYAGRDCFEGYQAIYKRVPSTIDHTHRAVP